MTRMSKREVERALEDLDEETGDGPGRIVIRDTVIPTDHTESEDGRAETTETVIDL